MEYLILPCEGISVTVKKGQYVTVTDVVGGQVADFFAESAERCDEFLSTGVTIDVNERLSLKVSDKLYSNLYRPMLTIIKDEVKKHDLLHPCCRPEMYDFFIKTEITTRIVLTISTPR